MYRLPFVFMWCAACAAEPASYGAAGYVIEPIDREIVLESPLPARLYVHYRAVSYPGRIVEYGVTSGGRELLVSYALDATSPRPLQTRIHDAATGAPMLALLASEAAFEVYRGDGAFPVLRVDGYTDPATALGEATGALGFDPALRPVLDAVLPARSEIAPVPAFWQNVDQPEGSDDGVGHTSSSGRPVLPAWSSAYSLLGALFFQSPCLISEVGFACPCMHFEAPAVGAIDTCP